MLLASLCRAETQTARETRRQSAVVFTGGRIVPERAGGGGSLECRAARVMFRVHVQCMSISCILKLLLATADGEDDRGAHPVLEQRIVVCLEHLSMHRFVAPGVSARAARARLELQACL